MRLLTALVLRLMFVVLFCLSLTVVWILLSTHHSIDAAATQSAQRVEAQLRGIYWQQLLWRNGLDRTSLLPMPNWRTLETQSLIAPGICVAFTPPAGDKSTMCSQTQSLGAAPPEWFTLGYSAIFGGHATHEAFLSVREKTVGSIHTYADADAAMRIAWAQVSSIVAIASMLALGIGFLAALMIGQVLLPAQTIIGVLHQLEAGNLSQRVPPIRSAAFNTIAGAVNDLGENLQHSRDESRRLTARLLEIQEEERRAIARDLHDEFGQSLTATSALAALIEANAAPDRDEIAADARAISRIQKDMMETLRSTLVRLRSQSIEEVGLEANLRQLVADYNTQSSAKAVYRLDISGGLATLHQRVCVDLYRIVQECLTNATRHGAPNEVRVSVAHIDNDDAHIALVVEDDGGGDVRTFKNSGGYGLQGIRERIAALGGSLAIGNVARGVRVSAKIPLSAVAPIGPVAGAPA